MRILKIMGGALAVLVALWAGGLLWFANTLPEQPSPIIQETDAVVVLTGGSETAGAATMVVALMRMVPDSCPHLRVEIAVGDIDDQVDQQHDHRRRQRNP